MGAAVDIAPTESPATQKLVDNLDWLLIHLRSIMETLGADANADPSASEAKSAELSMMKAINRVSTGKRHAGLQRVVDAEMSVAATS